MILLIKILCLLALSLATITGSAQSRRAKKNIPQKSETQQSEPQQSEAKKIETYTTEIVDNFVMPENAPFLNSSDNRSYHLRRVNIHGVKHINHDIIRSSSGLTPGDSIYLSGSFIQNAMMRLWSQRYFEDIQIGATIDGDSVDLEVMLRERPRVMNWAVSGVSNGKSKDLIDEVLKLKRGYELSDHIADKNIKLIKEHFAEKGFLDCEVDMKVEPDTVIKQAVNVTFNVKKNHRIRIGEINFIGNENFKDSRLARTFKKTHKISPWFWQKTKFNEKEYEEDKELMLDFYNSKGFRNANIISDSVYSIPATKKSYSLRLPIRYISEFIENEKEIHSKDALYLKEYLNPANLEKKRAEGVGYIYKVRQGDNLGLIAKRNRCTVKDLMKWNKLNSTVIRPGQKLRIEKPKPRG